MKPQEIEIELNKIRRQLIQSFGIEADRIFVFWENEQAHAIVLRKSYPAEEIARIASSCPGETSKDRIVEAMKLLEAIEKNANPDPWENQHLFRRQGDGLGDLPEIGDAGGERRADAKFLVEWSTIDGVVPLKTLLALCYDWVGRPGGDSARSKAFATWVKESIQLQEMRDHRRTLDATAKKPAKKKRGGRNPGEAKRIKFYERIGLAKEGNRLVFACAEAAVQMLADAGQGYLPFLKWLHEPRRTNPHHESETGHFTGKNNHTERTKRKLKCQL
jgi:hypothetical protein